jgi:hypothetical protein
MSSILVSMLSFAAVPLAGAILDFRSLSTRLGPDLTARWRRVRL